MNNRFAAELGRRLPSTVKALIPPEQLSLLSHNPQALVSAGAQGQLQSILGQAGSPGAALFQQVLQVLRQALASALSQVFLFALLAVVIAFLTNLFIREIPLRRQHTMESMPPKRK